MQEDQKTKDNKRYNKILLIVIILVMILLLFSCIIIFKIGRIGYQVSSTGTEKVLEISQNNISWENVEDLDIFNNPYFNNQKIVVPNSKGTYEFEIKNEMNEKIEYNLYMNEINEHNVNMKYRLKFNNVYVVGDEETWVDVEEVRLENVHALKNSSSIYTLEWYWEDDENDTEIGKLVYAEYKCKINLSAQIYAQEKDV